MHLGTARNFWTLRYVQHRLEFDLAHGFRATLWPYHAIWTATQHVHIDWAGMIQYQTHDITVTGALSRQRYGGQIVSSHDMIC